MAYLAPLRASVDRRQPRSGYPIALDYILKGISLGKHVATANKEVMARQGPDILTMARKKGVHVLFEATVAGGHADYRAAPSGPGG